MLVRPILPDDDHAEAGRIVREAYLALEGYPVDDTYDAVVADVPARIDEAVVVVAVDDGRILGCLTFVDGHDNPHAEHGDPDAASFRYFGVAASAQGRGVGREMVTWCVGEARRLGRRRLRIHTLEVMVGARRLYEQMGFERDPAFDEEWDGIVGLAYRLDIEA